MPREITCYVYDNDDHRYAYEYLVTVGTKEGYTKPTVGDMNDLQAKIGSKLHKTPASLKRLANSSPFDLAVNMQEFGAVAREQLPAELQEQACRYDAK